MNRVYSNRNKKLKELREKQRKEKTNIYDEIETNLRKVNIPYEVAKKLPRIYEVNPKTKEVYLRA